MKVKISPVGARGGERFMLEAMEGGYITRRGQVSSLLFSAKFFGSREEARAFAEEHGLEIVPS